MDGNILKNQGSAGQPAKKPNKKGERPVQVTPRTELRADSDGRRTWICKNTACGAVLSMFDTFCKWCSCFLCHSYDNNKDPSVWFQCTRDSCILSCHIECALQHQQVGVVNRGQVMQLDGRYCCAGCGYFSEVLGFWKKQLIIAKDFRDTDNLCYRVYTSFRLLDGTSRFRALHQIVKEAKELLETEVGPLDRVSAKRARSIACRPSVVAQVQELCKAALQKANELSSSCPDGIDWPIPAAFMPNNNNDVVVTVPQNEGAKDLEPDSGFKVGDVGEIPLLPWVDTCQESSGLGQMVQPSTSKAYGSPSKATGLDLNTFVLPDLNEPNEEEPDMGPTLAQPMAEADQRSDEPENWAQHGPNEEMPGVDLQARVSEKRTVSMEAHNSERALVHVSRSPLPAHTQEPDNIYQTLNNCMKVIYELECEGHISKEFRQKLFTCLGMSSSEQERRVVDVYIRTFGDDHTSLAEQLVDRFGDIILNNNNSINNNNKRPRR